MSCSIVSTIPHEPQDYQRGDEDEAVFGVSPKRTANVASIRLGLEIETSLGAVGLNQALFETDPPTTLYAVILSHPTRFLLFFSVG